MPDSLPIDQHQEARLESLKALQIMDTRPEERFDHLTRVGRALFNVPIALISLIDDERQWFKSCQGLDISETPREQSFCYHVVLGNDPLIIEDARQDKRFKDSTLVNGKEGILFYAGMPIHDAKGEVLGAFAIKDRVPRKLNAEEIDILKGLAQAAEIELNNQLDSSRAALAQADAKTSPATTRSWIDNFFALRSLKPLRMLSDSELMMVTRVARSQSFPAGHLIADNKDPLNRLYLLVEGAYVTDDKINLHPVVGVVSLLFNEPPPYPIYAGPQGAKCIMLLKAQYFTLINACPRLMRSFIEMIHLGNK